MINSILKSWKTTVVGFFLIAAALYLMISAKSISTESITIITLGIGLIVAKDSNVSGT